jgi:cysteinyl-tRNA synthetase
VPSSGEGVDWEEAHAMRFKAAMDDDFNTPEAVAVLFDLANETNRSGSGAMASQLRGLAGVLGLLTRDPAAYLQSGTVAGADESGVEAIEALIARRALAKKGKDYAEADRIRAQLLEGGVVLEDTPQGTHWRRA